MNDSSQAQPCCTKRTEQAGLPGDIFAGRELLLIDDEPINFMILNELMKEHGLELRHERDGESGIKAALAQVPSLIFLDVMMPGIDGFETCRQLKANPLTADIPVIFITALDDIQSKIKGFEGGGVDYISKPFQREEVIKRMELHLRLSLTQQRLAEEAAECSRLESELQKFYRAFEQAPLPIFITDLEGRIEFANKAFIDSSGYERFEVLGSTPEITQSGLNSPEVYKELWACLLSGQSWQGQLINRQKDGVLYWEQVTISPLYDQQGNIANYLAIKEDISSYKEYEERLLSCEKKLRFYTEQDLFAYIEWDPEFLITAWNAGAARIFGYTGAEALGRPGFALLVPEEQRAEVETAWQVINHGGLVLPEGPMDNLDKRGERIRCTWHNTPILDHNNAVAGVASLVLLTPAAG